MSEDLKSGQYVTFSIDGDTFAIEVFKIKEIIEVPVITVVPGMAEIVRGIVNIRSLVIPVIDIKMKFRNERTETTRDTAIIVIEIKKEKGVALMGIIVDSAQSVITLDETQIEDPPKVGRLITDGYLKGIGKTDEGFVLLLDTDKLLSDEEINVINQDIS